MLLLLSPMSFKGIIIFTKRSDDNDEKKCIDGVYNCGMCNVSVMAADDNAITDGSVTFNGKSLLQLVRW